MRELIYLSKWKLGMFYPGHKSRSVQFTSGLELGPMSAGVDVSIFLQRQTKKSQPSTELLGIWNERPCTSRVQS